MQSPRPIRWPRRLRAGPPLEIALTAREPESRERANAYRGSVGERLDWWGEPDDGVPELGRSARVRPRRAPGIVDLVATVLVLGTAVMASPAAWFAVVIGQMAFDACSESSAGCHVRAGSAVGVWHPVATIGVLVVGICWAVGRRLRGRAGWPIAVATLLGVIAVFLAAVITIQVASGGHLLSAHE